MPHREQEKSSDTVLVCGLGRFGASTADALDLVLIDLHRVQMRRRVPTRWLLKDLAGLLFSALDCGLTTRDLLRFLKEYRQRPWREVLAAEGGFWRRVSRRARRLYAGFHGRPAPSRHL